MGALLAAPTATEFDVPVWTQRSLSRDKVAPDVGVARNDSLREVGSSWDMFFGGARRLKLDYRCDHAMPTRRALGDNAARFVSL